jgi:uncharacterized protein YbjT (DUF2867 family)
VFVQPQSAGDVAAGLAEVAVSEPVNGIVELGGPEQFRLDQLARRVPSVNDDPRLVTADVHAHTFGTELTDRSLTPSSEACIARPTSRTGSARPSPGNRAGLIHFNHHGAEDGHHHLVPAVQTAANGEDRHAFVQHRRRVRVRLVERRHDR